MEPGTQIQFGLTTLVSWTAFVVRSRALAWVITILFTVPALLVFGPLLKYLENRNVK